MTEFQYKEHIKTLSIKELYDEIVSHVVGDDWDGMRSKTCRLPVMRSVCPKCKGKGWYFVNEWIGTLQGRKDCSCKGKLPS